MYLKLDTMATLIARYVPGYNTAINAAAPFLVPLFVMISPAIKPIYQLTDMMLLKNGKDAARPSASSKPIVVFASRTVKDAAAYKKAFGEYATQMQTSGKGVRAAFSFMDNEKTDTALQLFWFDGPGDYVSQPSSVTSTYKGGQDDYCQVWGGFDDDFKAKMSAVAGCKYAFVKEVRAGPLLLGVDPRPPTTSPTFGAAREEVGDAASFVGPPL